MQGRFSPTDHGLFFFCFWGLIWFFFDSGVCFFFESYLSFELIYRTTFCVGVRFHNLSKSNKQKNQHTEVTPFKVDFSPKRYHNPQRKNSKNHKRIHQHTQNQQWGVLGVPPFLETPKSSLQDSLDLFHSKLHRSDLPIELHKLSGQRLRWDHHTKLDHVSPAWWLFAHPVEKYYKWGEPSLGYGKMVG